MVFILESTWRIMNQRDKAIAYISGAIATYSLKKEDGEIQDNMSMLSLIHI